MKETDFEIKYGSKGGLLKLRELNVFQYSKGYIAKYFGVTKDAVRQWSYMFPSTRESLSSFNNEEDRKEIIIENMEQFAMEHTLAEFRFAFKKSKYYREILERVKREIYDIK